MGDEKLSTKSHSEPISEYLTSAIVQFPGFVFIIPLLFCSLLITYLSHLPSPSPPSLGFEFEDKIYHIIAYFGWGSSFLLFYRWRQPRISWQNIILFTILGCAFFGLYDEIHQMFVPNRTSTVSDWLADVIGGVIACGMYKPLNSIVQLWWGKRTHHST